ncbi:N-acetylglucosamine-6-phosphate deacetylase [Thermolongibacillus altinsuensis]|nr:N-acetylglucosamine-6-phosphate deacetylase [Thermolongibacillus altinsuensis]
MHYYLKAKTFFLEDGIKNNGFVEIKDGLFGNYVEKIENKSIDILDVGDCIVAPGLFDTHIHGISGSDVMDNTPESIQTISKNILKYGVTRFLPTTLTSSFDKLNQVVSTIYEVHKQGEIGAKIEGIFLEGPYFTKKHKGAQNSAYFKDPSINELNTWIEQSGGLIRKIALAPERKGALQFIKEVTNKGIYVALGHTDADYETCIQAIENGASIFVHLFNGMRGFHHREPGVVGAALSSENTFVELICDGEHVHPVAVNITIKNKGYDKICLVTDCMRAGLMPDGHYFLGEFEVHVKNGIAKTTSGSLAGSTLKLIDGIKNIYNWTNLSLLQCWHMGSLNPAKSIGLDDKVGSIAPNKKADFVVLNDQLEVLKVAIEGVIKYEKKFQKCNQTM